MVARARRHDRDRARRCRSLEELPGGRRRRPRPGAGRRRRDRRRAAAGPGRPRLPPLPPRAGRLQARPRGRGRRALDATRPPAGPGPCTSIGSFEEIARAERDVNRGRMPERPFVLVGQQYLADPARSEGDVHPVWAYAHVPSGYAGDASEAILDQIERFAPGLRERIVGQLQPLAGRARGLQRELRRRRHHHRRQHAAADRCSGRGSRSIPTHRHPRRLHLLGRDAARRRRPRDGRLQRRAFGHAYTYRMTFDSDRDSTFTLYRRGIELLAEEDFEQAAVPLEQAAREAPEKASVREALGRAYFRLGRFRRRGGRVQGRRRGPPGQRLRPLLPRPGALEDRRHRARPPSPGAGLEPAARARRLPLLPRPAQRLSGASPRSP